MMSPLLFAALAIGSLAQDSLDVALSECAEEYFRLEAAIDDEIFLADEVDLVLNELLNSTPDRLLRSEAEEASTLEYSLREEIRHTELALLNAGERLWQELGNEPGASLDLAIGRKRSELALLRQDVAQMDPAAAFTGRSPAELLGLDLVALEDVLRAQVARHGRVRESLTVEAERTDSARRSYSRHFVAAQRQALHEEADPARLERLAKSEYGLGHEYLLEASRTGGMWRETMLRAAERRLTSVVESYPVTNWRAVALDEVGSVRLALGRKAAAQEAYATLLSDYPGHPLTSRAAGELLAIQFSRGNHAEVLASAKRFHEAGIPTTLDPDLESYYRGISALSIGDAATSQLALEAISAHSVLADEAQLALASAHAAQGDTEVSRELLLDLAIRLPEGGRHAEVRDRALLSLGLLFFEAGRFVDSAELLDDVRPSSPVAAAAALASARSRFAAGQEQAARTSLLAIREEHPGSVEAAQALIALADVEADHGNIQVAEAWLEELVHELADDERVRRLIETEQYRAAVADEKELLEQLERELVDLYQVASRAGQAAAAEDLASAVPEVRALAHRANVLTATVSDVSAAALPELLRRAEIRLANLSLAQMHELHEKLAGIQRPIDPVWADSQASGDGEVQ